MVPDWDQPSWYSIFHVQLIWRSWLSDQIDSATHLPLPDFCTGLCTLEQNNNQSWVPSYVNVPQLQAMGQVTRTIGVAQQQRWILSAGNVGHNNGGGGGTSGGQPRWPSLPVVQPPTHRRRV
jgi:hypothetical protein